MTGHAADDSASTSPIRVLVAGPNGRMGGLMMQELGGHSGIEVTEGLTRNDAAAQRLLAGADVLVDFTHMDSAPDLILDAIKAGVRPVSGTSGLSEDVLSTIDDAARTEGIGAVWAPNFGLGGVMAMHLAQIAARYFDSVEIVEAHHLGKADAPSGTTLQLTRLLQEAHGGDFSDPPIERETLDGTRGGLQGGVRVHSLRLPGVLGYHEVIFGGDEEVFTIRQETFGRKSYVPAVARTIREVMRPDLVGLVRGYDAVIGLTTERQAVAG